MSKASTRNVSVVVKATEEQVNDAVVDIFRQSIREAVDARGVCTLALAGGTTPYALYLKMARVLLQDEVPWASVEIFFGDERDVPPDDIESNYGMVQRTLLDYLPIEPKRVHPMPTDAEDLNAAAADYEAQVRAIVPAGPDKKPSFDLILLGMGTDGHTASLFPDSPLLAEKHKLIAVDYVPKLGRKRMTFTLPLINAARHVVFLVTGHDKAQPVARVLSDDSDRIELPSAWVNPRHGALTFALDAAAGKMAGLRPQE
ncbi:MAG: 6-phosphogluconolactonase [Planctomycetaceae bacterium]|nr:6-phosphogluconolactonase [Planctomycetaceae bacterium]